MQNKIFSDKAFTPNNPMGYTPVRCLGTVSAPSFGRPGKTKFRMKRKACNTQLGLPLLYHDVAKCPKCGGTKFEAITV